MTLDDSLSVRMAPPGDAEVVAEIYNHYVLHTIVTFELDEVSPAEIARRMERVHSLSLPWIVAESGGQVIGYAYANRWHERGAFKHSAETTIYLEPNQRKRGVGSRLYDELLQRVSELDIHTVIGGIALPNEASVSLHEKFGFKKAAHYHEVGFKFGRWIDLGYWQRMM